MQGVEDRIDFEKSEVEGYGEFVENHYVPPTRHHGLAGSAQTFTGHFAIDRLRVVIEEATPAELLYAQCREELFDTGFVILHALHELSYPDTLAGTQSPDSQTECRRAFPLAVAGVDLQITFRRVHASKYTRFRVGGQRTAK